MSNTIRDITLELCQFYEYEGMTDIDLVIRLARFKCGQVYARRRVHHMLGGQEQVAISTPRSASAILPFLTEQSAN